MHALTCRAIIDLCIHDPRVKPHVDPNNILLAGHSRGGKLSVLVAARDRRVRAVALIDPVDNTIGSPSGACLPVCFGMWVGCGWGACMCRELLDRFGSVCCVLLTGPNYPSCLPGLASCTGPPRSLPVVVIGAALNSDVIPQEGNYKWVPRTSELS